MAKNDAPPTWQDALSGASQAIAAGLAAPGADVKFGLAMIGAISAHLQKAGSAGAGAPGQPPGAGGPPPGPGGPPSPAPAGGGQPNQAMPSMGAPGAPTPGGVSQGLGLSGPGNNPDEMRRVLADVAGS